MMNRDQTFYVGFLTGTAIAGLFFAILVWYLPLQKNTQETNKPRFECILKAGIWKNDKCWLPEK